MFLDAVQYAHKTTFVYDNMSEWSVLKYNQLLVQRKAFDSNYWTGHMDPVFKAKRVWIWLQRMRKNGEL